MVQFLTDCADHSVTEESTLHNVLAGKNADPVIAIKRKWWLICLSCRASNALVAGTQLTGYADVPFF
jgi:hypothetical protein